MEPDDAPISAPSLADEAVRRDLARVVYALLDRWDLPDELQLNLLGMSPESGELLPRYRSGERALPNSRDTLDRAGFLLEIHKGLRLLFPESQSLRYGWVKIGNRMLEGRTPLEVMVAGGFLGVARIARFVDFQRGQ